MISGKEAANVAHKYLEDILERRFGTEIKEMEIDDSGEFWLVTLRYWDDPGPGKGGIILPDSPDKYKTFKIRLEDGEVISMKIRTL